LVREKGGTLNQNAERIVVFAEPDMFLHELIMQARPRVN
jgi:hypothetical protein